MKVFEFKQIESGSNFRIEIDYHHYMQKQTAWLDGDILEMARGSYKRWDRTRSKRIPEARKRKSSS